MAKTTPPGRPAVLLLGNYRPALAVARGLAADFRVILSREGDEGGCELSRYVAEVWDNPTLADSPDAFLAALNDFLRRRPDIGAVLPVAEEFVNFLSEIRWTPPANVVLASPSHDVVQTFADKITSLSLAARVGVHTLPFERVSGHRELMDAARRIGFPITVRPLGTTARLGKVKALIAGSVAELLHALPTWPPGHQVLLLQRFAAGSRHNVFFAARGGELLAVAESQIRRTNHVSGTGLAVSGLTVPPTPDLTRDTRLLIEATNYTGIGLAQFIVGNNGDRCFLELNPRVSGSHAVPEQAGISLSRMAVALARDERIAVPQPYLSGTVGLRYVWTSGEIIGLKSGLRDGLLSPGQAIRDAGRAMRDALSADLHIVWSWRDPMPGLRTLWHLLPSIRRRLVVTGDDERPRQSRKQAS